MFRITWFLWIFRFVFSFILHVSTQSNGFHQRGCVLTRPQTLSSLVPFPGGLPWWPSLVASSLPHVTPPFCFLITHSKSRSGFFKNRICCCSCCCCRAGVWNENNLTALFLRQGLMYPRSASRWQWHWASSPLGAPPCWADAVLVVQPCTLGMLGEHSSSWAMSPAPAFKFYYATGSIVLPSEFFRMYGC